jgi:hypothetical protein
VATGTLTYRLVVEDPDGTPHAAGDNTVDIDGAHFVVTSERDTNCPYICDPPEGDGGGIDPLTGKMSDGAYRIGIADADVSAGSLIALETFNDYGPGGTNPDLFWAEITATGSLTTTGGEGPDLTRCFRKEAEGGQYGTPPGAGYGNNTQTWARTWGVADGLLPDTQYSITFDVDYNTIRFGGSFAAGAAMSIVFGIEASPTERYLMHCTYPTDPDLGPREDAEVPADAEDVTQWDEGVEPPWWPDFDSVDWQSREFVATTDGSGDLTLTIGFWDWRNIAGVFRIDNIRISEVGCGGTGRVVTRQLADSEARMRLLGRRAWLELSFDLGASYTEVVKSGFLTDTTLTDGIRYELTIGDGRRVERRTPMFAQASANFLQVTPLLGGPVYGGFPPHFANYGLPVFRVTAVVPEDVQGNVIWQRGFVTLRYLRGPLPPNYSPTQSSFTTQARDYINKRARPFAVQTAPIQFGDLLNLAASPFEFPRIVVSLEDAGDGVPTVTEYTPVGGVSPAPIPFPSAVPGATIPNDELITATGEITVLWTDEQPSVGDDFYLHVYPMDVGPDNPMHWTGHVVDLVADRLEDAGISYDTASRDALKDAIGLETWVMVRWTDPKETMQAFFERLFGAFGFGLREGLDGEREFFATRIKLATNPSVSLDDDDVIDRGSPPWTHNESTMCNTLRIVTHRLARWRDTDDPPRPPDDLISVESTVVVDYSTDAGATREATKYGEALQEYQLPGITLIGSQYQPVDVVNFARTVGLDTFSRYGRGAPHREIRVRRGGGADAVGIGDEITVDLGHLPTAVQGRTPVAQRGGAHDLLVIRRTESPGGPTFVCVDASNGISASIVPDLTITEDTDAFPSGGYVLIEVTNGGAIAIAGYGLRIQYALSLTEPTGDGTVLYTDDPLQLILRAPAYAYQAGPYPAGETVWVRGQAWIPGGTPSAWGDWVSVTLAGLATITGIASSDTSPTSELVTWTNGSTTFWIDVQIKETSAASYYQLPFLPPGSDRYEFTGLTPSTSYDIRLRYTNGVSVGAYATFTFTTNSGSTTLTAPINPIAWRGLDRSSIGLPVLIDGRYGLRVNAQSVPSDLVFEVAVETAVGSGTPGSYAEFARVSANPPFTTTQAGDFAPNDGKLRYLRAKSVWPGFTDSPYSSPVVSIDPWGNNTTTPGTNGSAGTPAAPGISYFIDTSGLLDVFFTIDSATTEIRYAYGAVNGSPPSDTSVRLGTNLTAAPWEELDIVLLNAGDYVIVGAYAYDSIGNESVKATLTITRPTSVDDILLTDSSDLIITDASDYVLNG